MTEIFQRLADFIPAELIVAIAGLIDSIAGGGGLITVPLLSWIVGPGAPAIGTNKILGSVAAFIALIVYWQAGHLRANEDQGMNKKLIAAVLAGILVGTIAGALTAPKLPVCLFPWALLILSPLLLLLLLRRDGLIHQKIAQLPNHRKKTSKPAQLAFAVGLGCGFYDGVFGPGGGTLMLISMVWLLELPLMPSIALSKLSNTLSAGGSLLTYAALKQVHWGIGLWLALFIGAGALIGSKLANRHAEKILRPLLVLVVTLLWIRMLLEVAS